MSGSSTSIGPRATRTAMSSIRATPAYPAQCRDRAHAAELVGSDVRWRLIPVGDDRLLGARTDGHCVRRALIEDLDFVNRLERFGQAADGASQLRNQSSQTRRWREQ